MKTKMIINGKPWDYLRNLTKDLRTQVHSLIFTDKKIWNEH